MPIAGRRSEELQKKLRIRNKSLKPADFTKEHVVTEPVEKSKDPVEKTKASLSDLRKRLDERKRVSKPVGIQQYQERREEIDPELIEATTDESPPASEREESFPKEESILRSAQKQKQALIHGNVPSQGKLSSRNLKDHYMDQRGYRASVVQEEKTPPPSQIEVRSTVAADDDNTVVSEITTDVRIMSTKGAVYAEQRMSGKVQMRLTKPSLNGPSSHYLEKDVNINVNNLRHLGEAVEKAKNDLRQEMLPTNKDIRHGLPYEDTDFRASIDDEEGDSWEDAIVSSNHERNTMLDPEEDDVDAFGGPSSPEREQQSPFLANKGSGPKLQHLVKEAYSHEGDVFIDATEVKEEDLDFVIDDVTEDESNNDKRESSLLGTDFLEAEDEEYTLDEEIPGKPNEDNLKIDESQNSRPIESEEQCVQHSEPKKASMEDADEDNQDFVPDRQSLDECDKHDDVFDDKITDDGENEASDTGNDPASIAADFFKSPLGFFKSISSQVDTQMKAIQERGMIVKQDMDRMLGALQKDGKSSDDEVEKPASGADTDAGEESMHKNKESSSSSNLDPVEKMIESLKNTYVTGMSKCGVDSDIIAENTKAIEKMVANLKNPNGGPADSDQRDDLEQMVSEDQFESSPDGKLEMENF